MCLCFCFLFFFLLCCLLVRTCISVNFGFTIHVHKEYSPFFCILFSYVNECIQVFFFNMHKSIVYGAHKNSFYWRHFDWAHSLHCLCWFFFFIRDFLIGCLPACLTVQPSRAKTWMLTFFPWRLMKWAFSNFAWWKRVSIIPYTSFSDLDISLRSLGCSEGKRTNNILLVSLHLTKFRLHIFVACVGDIVQKCYLWLVQIQVACAVRKIFLGAFRLSECLILAFSWRLFKWGFQTLRYGSHHWALYFHQIWWLIVLWGHSSIGNNDNDNVLSTSSWNEP